jgi:signal transduction histidine kinase
VSIRPDGRIAKSNATFSRWIGYSKEELDGKRVQDLLHVANAGAPIPPATLARIFQPFTRGEDRPSRQGLGLGLYIAHQIAVAHGGTLEAESTADETRFTFRMPTSTRIQTGEGG